ncbi:MAG: IS66 family transposase [Kiritimatiellia bacterium]|jgi:transposase
MRARSLSPDLSYCKGCLEKQRTIDRLREDNKRLRAKLRRQERTALEEPFGSSTPSSKRLVKPSSTPERRARRGGAKPGHEGHGRASVGEEDAAGVDTLPASATCPDRGCALEDWGARERTVYDCEPVRRKARLVRIGEGRCPRCGKTHRSRLPGVLPRSSLSNRLVAQAAVWHHVDGLTMGHVSRQLEVPAGTLFGRMRAPAEICRPAVDKLLGQYRAAAVKHADETGWRNDGANGYARGFFTRDTSVFLLRDTRSGSVAREALGEGRAGEETLLADRFGGYNRFGGDIQHCYAHLKRNTEDIVKKNPESEECKAFADGHIGDRPHWLPLAPGCGASAEPRVSRVGTLPPAIILNKFFKITETRTRVVRLRRTCLPAPRSHIFFAL